MSFNDRVLCVPTSAVLTDGYFQIIPEIIVHLSNVNTWGIENKCPSFCVWDSRAFELRLDVIYDLAPYQSLNMQIVSTPMRNMADSLRRNGFLSLGGSSLFLSPILYEGVNKPIFLPCQCSHLLKLMYLHHYRLIQIIFPLY